MVSVSSACCFTTSPGCCVICTRVSPFVHCTMLQLGRSGSLAGLACKSAPPVQGTEPVQRVGGIGITNYQLSECSNSGKVTRFSQSRPCLEGTAQQTPLGTRFSLAGQLCPAPFLGAALKAKGFAPAHYKYISLTFIFKLFC